MAGRRYEDSLFTQEARTAIRRRAGARSLLAAAAAVLAAALALALALTIVLR